MNVLHSISAQKQTSDALLPKRPGRNGSTHAHIVRTGRTQYCDLKKPGGTVRAYTHTHALASLLAHPFTLDLNGLRALSIAH